MMYVTLAIILVLGMSPQAISSFPDILSDTEISKTGNSSFGNIPNSDGVNEEKCSNDGTWVYNNRCLCQYGTRGDRCEIVDDCQTENICGPGKDVECVYLKNLLITNCQCKDTSKAFNYTEMACRSISGSCQEDACLHGGHCNEKGLCECQDFSYGARCEYVICKPIFPECVASGGQCKLEKLLDTTYWEPYCDCPETKIHNNVTGHCVDPCKPEMCQNGGTCDGRICNCSLFTSGPKCENVNCSSAGLQCEESGGKCKFNISLGKPYCECPSAKVYDKDLNQCEEYENATCRNGGTSNESGTCDCLPNTNGPQCEIVNCTLKTPECEESGGKCKYNVSSGTPYCQCPLNKFFRVELNKCQGKCQSLEFSCQNGGVCNKLGTCDCVPLSSGDRCESVNCTFVVPECESSGGRCGLNIIGGDPICFCGPKKYFHRESRRCIDKCNKDACINGGNCIGRCYCLPHTSGIRCENVECESIYPNCEETGGKCKYDLESRRPYCDCQSPKVYNKEAKKCGEYKKDACFNGATINKFGDCGCLASTSGERCENIDCDSGLVSSIRCEVSGGTCKYDIEFENAFCECPATKEYNAVFDKCIESCNTNSCQNGGTCTQLSSGTLCNCGTMYSGNTCEKLNGWMVFGYTCLALSLLILFLRAGWWLKKRQQLNREVPMTLVTSQNQ